MWCPAKSSSENRADDALDGVSAAAQVVCRGGRESNGLFTDPWFQDDSLKKWNKSGDIHGIRSFISLVSQWPVVDRVKENVLELQE